MGLRNHITLKRKRQVYPSFYFFLVTLKRIYLLKIQSNDKTAQDVKNIIVIVYWFRVSDNTHYSMNNKYNNHDDKHKVAPIPSNTECTNDSHNKV